MTARDDALIPVFLYRSDLGGQPLYGESRQIQQIRTVTVIGVAARPAGETIEATRYEGDFRDAVVETCERVEWLDEEIKT